jgi:DNA-directed RNA polymerase II subunit RPB7
MYLLCTSRGDCWCSTDQETEIKEGSIVRLRIMGITIEAGAISAIGTIKDNYLGLYE